MSSLQRNSGARWSKKLNLGQFAHRPPKTTPPPQLYLEPHHVVVCNMQKSALVAVGTGAFAARSVRVMAPRDAERRQELRSVCFQHPPARMPVLFPYMRYSIASYHRPRSQTRDFIAMHACLAYNCAV